MGYLLSKFGIKKKICSAYHGANKMVPGTLDSVRSSKGIKLILTMDSDNAGRQLFHIPCDLELQDGNKLRISMLGNFAIEAHESLLIDILRLSIFRDGEYAGWIPLNGQKSFEKIQLSKGCSLKIYPEQKVLFNLSTYVIQLEGTIK